MSDTPEGYDFNTDLRTAYLKTKVDEVNDIMAKLMRQGVQPSADIETQVSIKLLIDHFFPDGSPERLEFDIKYVEAMADAMKQIQKEVNQAKLMGGLPMNGKRPGI